MSSVHAHISRLRSALEPGRGRQKQPQVLRSTPTGYALSFPPEPLDSMRFEQSVRQAQAQAQADAGRVGEALRETECALAMWRGTPLVDARVHHFVEGESGRLQGLKLSAEELRTALLLQENRIIEAVTGAERLVERDPLREASWIVLMRALYAAGRPAEALRRYEEVRALLARALGLDPGPELRETQPAVLRHDTVTLRRPPCRVRVAPHGAHGVLPERPAGVRPDLPGREGELGRLSELLRGAATGRTRWAEVSGEPGVGKPRVAEEVARQASDTGWHVLRIWCAEGSSPGARVPERQLQQLDGQLRRPAGRACVTGPTLCVVEDVHLASDDVRRLLVTYARTLREAPLAVVCTVADESGPATERFLAELAGRGADVIPLAPLTVAAVRRVVSAATDGPVPEDAARRLHELSGANPFLLNQVLTHARNLGAAPHSGPSWSRVPPAVRSVVRARLAELSPAARQVVDRAAAIGDRPDMRLVTRLGRMPLDEALRLADQAVAVRLLAWSEEASPDDGQGYRFPAGVLRWAVLGELSPARRRTPHADAVTARAVTARPAPRGGSGQRPPEQLVCRRPAEVEAHEEMAGQPARGAGEQAADVDGALLEAMIGEDRAAEVFDWLRALPFAGYGRRGLFLHERVNEALDQGLCRRDLDGNERVHVRTGHRLLQRARTAPGTEAMTARGRTGRVTVVPLGQGRRTRRPAPSRREALSHPAARGGRERSVGRLPPLAVVGHLVPVAALGHAAPATIGGP
ncbi:BTAD domain-containing putative transcriptional regulator [Streptomyces sp. NPDC093586]|uniref:BTAD domain-containing putative transcriptional regulator n=1 Tax=Streptomyces sp. NPDC093586 TaxID=3366042 RepID=UPI0037FF8979